jgi:hypothetical protein
MDIDEKPETTRRRALLGSIVALAAVGWIVASFLLLLENFGFALRGLGGPLSPYEEMMATRYEWAWGIVTLGAPAAIAVFAWCVRFRKTGWVFFLLAVALMLALGAGGAFRTQEWPEPEPEGPGPPGYCVEHSGGDTRCPGG